MDFPPKDEPFIGVPRIQAVTPYTKPKEYARSGNQKEPAGAQTIALSLSLWAMEMLVMLRDSFSFNESKVSCTIRSDSLSRAEVALPRDEKNNNGKAPIFRGSGCRLFSFVCYNTGLHQAVAACFFEPRPWLSQPTKNGRRMGPGANPAPEALLKPSWTLKGPIPFFCLCTPFCWGQRQKKGVLWGSRLA